MAIANAIDGKKVKLFVSDGIGVGDARFKFACVLNENQFNRENVTESKFKRDCSDDEAVAQRIVRITGQQFDITGTGDIDPAHVSYTAMETAFRTGADLEIKVTIGSAGAGRSYTGFVKVTKFNVTGGVTAFAQVTIEMAGTGALTEATLS